MQDNKLGPALILCLGGTGKGAHFRTTRLLRAAGLNAKSGAVRTILLDIPVAQGVDVTNITFQGAPYGDAVAASRSAQAGYLSGYEWLSKQPTPTTSVSQLTQGAGMNTHAGRFSLMFNIERVMREIDKALAELLVMDRIDEGLSVIICSSLAGGAGSSMVWDVALLVKHLVTQQNRSLMLNTSIFGVLLGPAAFLPVTRLQMELKRNTGASAVTLDALMGGRLAGRTMKYAQQGTTLAQVDLSSSPFTSLFLVDVTRDRESSVGGPETGGAIVGDIAFLLCHRVVRQKIAEMQYNVEMQRGGAGIITIGYDMLLTLNETVKLWLTHKLAADLSRSTIEPAFNAVDWLERVYAKGMNTLPDAMPRTRIRDVKSIRQILDVSFDRKEVPQLLRKTLFGSTEYQGLVGRMFESASDVIRLSCTEILQLNATLVAEIARSKSPAELRNWYKVVESLWSMVKQAIASISHQRQQQLLQRDRQDSKLPPQTSWEKYQGDILDEYASRRMVLSSSVLDAANAYVAAVQRDLTRRVEDKVYNDIVQALGQLAEHLAETAKMVRQQTATLDSLSRKFAEEAAGIMTEMITIDQAVPLTHVIGLPQLGTTYAQSQAALVAHALANLDGFTPQEIYQCAVEAIGQVGPELPSAYVNGTRPTRLWATTPRAQQTQTFPFNLRVNPRGTTAAKDEGIMDIDGGGDFAVAINLSMGHNLGDLSGLEEAMSIAKGTLHPFMEHAQMQQ